MLIERKFTLIELKAIFIAGMDRESENILVNTYELEEKERKAKDFDEFMKEVFNITTF